MGTPQKLKLEKIVDVFEAIKLVEELKLEFAVSYRLGRLQDRCKSILKVYEQLQSKLQAEYSKKAQVFNSQMEGKSDEEKTALNIEVRNLNNEFVAEINKILQIEEEIVVPDFKLKDFEGKDVPVKFFSMMGELIKEE
jgi:predicted  nucleic acid-binding Zn-ribbon protein